MPLLPPVIASLYLLATDREIRSWSFGQVKAPRDPDAGSWETRRNTLDDQAIFGPEKDWECACGKYRGMEYKGMICDCCGVKLTSRAEQRRRFGHIELPASVCHLLGNGPERLAAVPVLPAVFFQSGAGRWLAQMYDELVGAARVGDAREISACLNVLVDGLLPVVRLAHDWDLQEAAMLACGLALERRTEHCDGRCVNCGYPLAGLAVVHCPNCGASRPLG